MSVIDDAQARRDLQTLARQYQKQLVSDRGVDAEAQLLEIIQQLETSFPGRKLGVKELTGRFIQRYEDEYEPPVNELLTVPDFPDAAGNDSRPLPGVHAARSGVPRYRRGSHRRRTHHRSRTPG
ncbi:MAG: hypothetical protein HY343_12415, partial [Lentisphaerae bacterium]|nr:hypothetical protein [Lentisphaerota bacterium]